MIIGEQRVSVENYYENSTHQFEALKRKLSNENENDLGNYSDRPEVVKNCSSSSSSGGANINKMHYVDSVITDTTYHTYQTTTTTEQIHHDGKQSYINLTVMAPSSLIQHYNKNQVNCQVQNHQQQQITYTSTENHQNNKQQTITTANMGKYEVKNYHQPDNLEDMDNEDKNLSWLFNFKLDEIANLSPEIKRKRTNTTSNNSHHHHHQQQQHQSDSSHSYFNNITINSSNATSQQQFDDGNQQRSTSKDACIEDDLNVAENVVISNTPLSSSYNSSNSSTHTPKKPPFTYTELIEYALEDKGELTVSGIYQWISDRFPYYKSNDDRWKNSVRHNLSINPHFRKGNKAKAGAGHLWKISSRESEANFLAWEHKKQRLELFFKMEAANNLKNQNATNRKEIIEINLNKHAENVNSPTYDAELSAATASIISLPIDTSSPIITTHADADSPTQFYQFQEILPITTHQQHHNQVDDGLRRAASEILSGVRRNVEVQIMHPNELQSYSILNTEDYLNPISKEEIMQESGLGRTRQDEFYLIDPGMNVNTGEESTEVFEIFHEDFNLNYFGNNNIIA
ncbi:hypothetical protein PVAND_010255 [Polypedilum vanderplanki]|uniref:Fork-head domain-containing protein n=1 Tax=Polypedilum vanderplanki TaxID=319348 RepID=A0A9J6CG44_POLVA|nr:hypothetical protein PVAND_010255 [Polypedilum vanderplanki]